MTSNSLGNDNLPIHGVPVPSDNSREGEFGDAVLDILNKYLNLNLDRMEISVAHRTRPAGPAVGQSMNVCIKQQPIVIRFTRRCVRNSILAMCRQLKVKNISTTEQLMSTRAALFKKAIDLVTSHKIKSAWSHDGRIQAKSKLNRTVLIQTEADHIQSTYFFGK